MDEKKQQALRERIAQGINHGLSNLEIYGIINDKGIIYPSDLIGVIRDLMTEKSSDFDDTQEIIVLTPSHKS
jgi:hypothetical protein